MAKLPVVRHTADHCRKALERRLREMRLCRIEAQRVPSCPCGLRNDFRREPSAPLDAQRGNFRFADNVRHQCHLQSLCNIGPVVFPAWGKRVADNRAARYIEQHHYQDPVHNQQSLEAERVIDAQR